jgi:hypothetical protein
VRGCTKEGHTLTDACARLYIGAAAAGYTTATAKIIAHTASVRAAATPPAIVCSQLTSLLLSSRLPRPVSAAGAAVAPPRGKPQPLLQDALSSCFRAARTAVEP